ncbi:MAG: transcriptional regulator, partial [Bifidobacteriaceae bacterium]|nr:transcriptional regulator [Bifidobacteriaceae bacterium]
YVLIEKVFEGRKPATYAALTPQGRAAFDQYLKTLRGLLAGPRETLQPPGQIGHQPGDRPPVAGI